MWPMSHALYPGLNNNNTRERPSTAESHKTWYGNNRKSYASASSLYSEPSLHSLSPEAEVPGEDLGDLIHRSRRVLSVLSVEDNENNDVIETPRRMAHSPARSQDGSESNARNITKTGEAIGNQEKSWPGPEEESSRPPTNSHQDAAPASYPPSLGPATERGGSSSSASSAFMSLVSPNDREGETTAAQSCQSLRAASTPSIHDSAKTSRTKPSNPLTEQDPIQDMGLATRPSTRDLASNKGDSTLVLTPAEDRTAAPSFTITWEPSEKTADFDDINMSSFSNDGSHSTSKEQEEVPEQAAEEEEGSANHLSGLPLVTLTIALSAAVFLVAMDVNVIATAVPRITGEFRSLDDVGWYGSSFLMATCATQIPYGRIYTLFPAKWVFISAIIVFMLGSLTAGVSPSSPVLIFGRAIQGVGTSGILAGGLLIMSQVVPLRIRPVLTSVIGAMEGVAMISAPIIGGVLTDNLTWRWCFYINLPIGGFVLLVVVFCMRNPPKPVRKPGKTTFLRSVYELDLLGAAALLPPIVCTLLALHFAGTEGHSWGDNDVILLLVLAVVLFCVFAYTQHINAEVAMLPFRVVKHRAVRAGFWFILCTSSSLVVITYYLPLWFQTIKDTSAQQSGIGILPMLVGVTVGVLSSGFLVSLVGYYTPFMWASSVLMPVGLGMLTTIGPDTPRAALLAYPAVFGLGVGVGFQQPLIAVQAALPQADIAPGTSVIVFGQTIGAAIMIAVGEGVFQTRLVANLASYLGLADINTHQLLGNGPAALQNLVPDEQVPRLIEAVSASFTQTFYVALALAALSCFGSLFMRWKSVKQPKKDDSEAGATAETVAA